MGSFEFTFKVNRSRLVLFLPFNEGGVLDNVNRFTSDEVDIFLVVLHSGDIVGQGGALFTAIMGWVVSEQVGDLGTVGGIFMDTEFDVATELKYSV